MPPLPPRFHPDASYVARKARNYSGVPVNVGDPVTPDMVGGLRGMERLYRNREIMFASAIPKPGVKPQPPAPIPAPQAAGDQAGMVAPPDSPMAPNGPDLAPSAAGNEEGTPAGGGAPEAGDDGAPAKAGNLPVQGQQPAAGGNASKPAEAATTGPLRARNKGFGQWVVEDARGMLVAGPMSKAEAQRIAGGR